MQISKPPGPQSVSCLGCPAAQVSCVQPSAIVRSDNRIEAAAIASDPQRMVYLGPWPQIVAGPTLNTSGYLTLWVAGRRG